MICLVCRQAEIVEGLTSVALERGEFKLLVNDVPGLVCPNCGEVCVEETVAVRLLEIARQRFNSGVVDTQSEYSPR